MLVVLAAGIICIGLFGLHLAHTLFAAQREREAALRSLRPNAEQHTSPRQRAAVFVDTSITRLARIHRLVWPRETPSEIETRLRQAGTSQVSGESFMAFRVVLLTASLVTGFIAARGFGKVLLAVVLSTAAIWLPRFFLSRAASRRLERIVNDLPHLIDQLAIAIEAGMSFDAALSYILQTSGGPLRDELAAVLADLRIGESRRAALRKLATRLGSDDIFAFVNAVRASEQLGTPLASILRAQAADLRHRLQIHAEERAQKAPVKMLFPIVLFILPVMFVVILAPALLGAHGVL